MGHDPSLGAWGTTGLPGVPPAYQGHHRPSRGTTELPRDTTCLSGPPQACQASTTSLAGAPVRGTTGLPGGPQACQGHHLSRRVTTGLPEASRGCQGLHSPFQGHQCTTGLTGAPTAYQGHQSEAPRACQGHYGPATGTTGLPRAPPVQQAH